MSTNHTPSPWTLNGEGILNHPVTGSPVMTRRIECGEGWGNCIEIYDTSNEPEANACLIVAAPELLAALRDAQQALAHAIYKLKDDPSFSTSIALKGAEGRARNAIAKAEFVPYSADPLPSAQPTSSSGPRQ
jgi:hypothetical protein